MNALLKSPPDRLSMETGSPFYKADLVPRVRLAIGGVEVTNVVEYCISRGWARVHVLDANGENVRNAIGTEWRIQRLHNVVIVAWWKGETVPAGVVARA